MQRSFLLVCLCMLANGCNGGPVDETKDLPLVYEAALGETLKDPSKGEDSFLFIEGKDPAPELLDLLHKKWPKLEPGSKVPAGKANRINLSKLEWIDRDTVELRLGTSNGMDGRGQRLRLTRKNGVWTVASVKTEAIS
jgi:hypothetical protein